MALIEPIVKVDVKDVIQLVKEHDEAERAIGDMFLMLHEYKQGREHHSIATNNSTARFVMKRIAELIKENKSLKEQLNANSTTVSE